MDKKSDKPSKIINVAGAGTVSSGHFSISQYFGALTESENDPARLKKLAAIFSALAEYASKKAALLKAMNKF